MTICSMSVFRIRNSPVIPRPLHNSATKEIDNVANRADQRYPSAECISFLLIMCIDVPESTTNSLSQVSGLMAQHTLFHEGEENAALFFSCNFRMLLASLHAASRAHRSCHSVSS